MFSPSIATVEAAENPVPVNVTVVAVLIGPAAGRIDVRVGGGGSLMLTVTELETAGRAVGVFTTTVAVPTLLRSAAGTVAMRL